MRLLRLTSLGCKPMEATIYRKKDKDGGIKKYYNIRHGSIESGFKTFLSLLDSRVYPVNEDENPLILDKDTYTIRPYTKVTDPNYGNTVYLVSESNTLSTKNDIILFWEIPNSYYTNVSYNIEGNARVIGSGSIGKIRVEGKFESPSPVVEIIGNCKLSWSAYSKNNGVTKHIEQHIEYDYIDMKWNIGIVEEKVISEVKDEQQ